MPRYGCRKCGRVSDQTHCPKHRKKPDGRSSWSKERDRGLQARFRREVLARDGHQCTYVEDGIRCVATFDLRACHVRPLRDFAPGDKAAYDPANGRTLCGPHDRLTDPYAR